MQCSTVRLAYEATLWKRLDYCCGCDRLGKTLESNLAELEADQRRAEGISLSDFLFVDYFVLAVPDYTTFRT